MVSKLFLLGRPGSGKSTAAHCIGMWASGFRRSVLHINDYEVLQTMFHADTTRTQFRSTERGGFDVLDFSVLDTTLQKVEERVQHIVSSTHINIVTIEFARDDYRKALKQCSVAFLRDIYILYIDTDIDLCLQRIRARTSYPITKDDHPSLSEEAFRLHYAFDNTSYMQFQLQKDYPLVKAVEVIHNQVSLHAFYEDIRRFVISYLANENMFDPM